MTKRLLALLLLALPALFVPAGELTIIENGTSPYTVVLPDNDAAPAFTAVAAEYLVKHLHEATGVTLPVCTESQLPAGKPAIYLGRTQAAVKAGIPFSKIHDWNYCQKVVGKDIFLVGYDASANLSGPLSHHDMEYLHIHRIDGNTKKFVPTGINSHIKDRSYKGWHGSAKAVLSFLEKFAGIHILQPGDNGRHIPKLDKLTVDDTLDVFCSPAFKYCNGRNYGDLETTIALNHNDNPLFRNYGGHSFNVAVPASRYAKSNPEYFVLVNGKRQPKYGPAGGNHLCISNPEVQELMLEEIGRQVNAGFSMVQVAPTDGQVACECEECKKINEHPGERQWIVFRKLAEEAKVRFPGVSLVFLSYGFTYKVPETFDTLPDNCVIEYCIWKDFAKKFKDWEKFTDVRKMTYIYFFGTYHSSIYSPIRSPKYVATNLRIMADNKVESIYKCGWCVSPGLEGPVCYVFSKLLEDPYQDYEKLADNYYRYAFADAYEPMKRFFDTMHQALDTRTGESVLDVIEDSPRNPERLHSFIYRPGMLNFMEQMLSLAEKTDNRDPRVRARIALVRREFDFLVCRSRLFCYINAFNYSRAPEMIPIIERELANRDRIVDAWYDADGNPIHEPGFTFPIMEDVCKSWLLGGGGQIPPSFPREVDFGIEPLKQSLGSGTRPEDMLLTAEKLPDSQAAAFFQREFTGEQEFGQGIAPVKVRLAYDSENLYVALQGGFANLKWGTGEVVAWAGSNDCLTLESLNVCLDLLGDGSRHFEFTFHPKEGLGKAIRVGYDNPQDPRYAMSEKWNDSDWSYSIVKEPKKERYFAYLTIPFRTLGSTPAAGSFWNLNIIRNHCAYPPAFNDGRAIIAPWSRRPGDQDYAQPQHYGRLQFAK